MPRVHIPIWVNHPDVKNLEDQENTRIWKAYPDWAPQVFPPFQVKIADEKHSQQDFLAVKDNFLLINNFYEGKGPDVQVDDEPNIEDLKFDEANIGQREEDGGEEIRKSWMIEGNRRNDE